MSNLDIKVLMLACSVLAIVFTFNWFNDDPYAAGLIAEASKQGAPKALSKGLSVYSYAVVAPKLAIGLKCIEEAYRIIDVAHDLGNKPNDKAAKDRFNKQSKFAQRLCTIAKELG
jgi:hypothetical protein